MARPHKHNIEKWYAHMYMCILFYLCKDQRKAKLIHSIKIQGHVFLWGRRKDNDKQVLRRGFLGFLT
jgi:hypothetical protein